MFGWLGLSNAIKKEASRYAKGQLRKLLKPLEAKRTAALEDLRSVLSDSRTFLAMNLAGLRTTDQIRAKPKESVALYTIPVSAFANSPIVANALAAKLVTNVELEAARNDLGFSTDAWKAFVVQYSATFVRFATRRVLKELCKAREPVFGGEVVLAIVDKEAYVLNGKAGHHDMIKFYVAGTGADRDARIKVAQRLWARRNSAGYKYDRNV